MYSGGPHTRFHEFWEGPLLILGSGAPLRRNPLSGDLKWTLPGPREGSSILNTDLVVVTAAVAEQVVRVSASGITWEEEPGMVAPQGVAIVDRSDTRPGFSK